MHDENRPSQPPVRQAHDISLRQLRTLLDAQTQLRRVAEEQAREARRQLEHLAEVVCPEEVDRIRRASPQGLSGLPHRRITDLVLAAVKPHLCGPAVVKRVPAQWQAEMEDQLAGLRRQLQEAEDRAAQAEAEVALLGQRLQVAGGDSTPSTGDSLCSRHGPQREALVRNAATLLQSAGYAVDPLPSPRPLPDGGAFLPDLTMDLEDKTLPVEVEDLARPLAERETRWEACHVITGGHLCFVVPGAKILDRLRSEVFYWAGVRPLRLWMTDLERAASQGRHTLWLVKRELG